jgi:hypothetical protein
MIGVITAPLMSAAVNTHCAELNETWSASAMVGINGAPRLLTTATRSPMKIRVGTTRWS